MIYDIIVFMKSYMISYMISYIISYMISVNNIIYDIIVFMISLPCSRRRETQAATSATSRVMISYMIS